MALIWTLLMLSLVILGGYWASKWLLKQPKGLARGLATFVLAWLWITVGMELLGPLGLLARPSLLAWSVLGALIGYLCRFAAKPVFDRDTFEESNESKWTFEAKIALGLALWSVGSLGMKALLLPVDVNSDGPIYHLWFAARWWQDGRLGLIPTPFGDSVATYFPAVGDLWFSWLMIAWDGGFLAKVGQAPFLIVSAWSLYALNREVGVDRSSSLISSSIFLTVSPLIIFAFEPNVDSIPVAGFLVSLFFFLRYAKGVGSWSDLVLGALSAGCSWGCKPTGLIFIPPLLFLVGLAACYRETGWQRKAKALLILLIGPMIPAGFWYGRALSLTGNPLYPLQVEAFGQVLLTGWFGREVMTTNRYFIDPFDWRALLDILLQVLDPRLVPLWILGIGGLWSVGGGQTRNRLQRRWIWLASALAIFYGGLYWGVIPYRTQQRFIFPAVGLATIPLGALISRSRLISLVATTLLALHVLSPQGWPLNGSGEAVEASIRWDFTESVKNALDGPVFLRLPDDQWLNQVQTALASGSVGATVRVFNWVFGPYLIGLVSVLAAWKLTQEDPFKALPRKRFEQIGVILVWLAVAAAVTFPWGAPKPVRFFPLFPDYYRGWITLDRLAGTDGARIAYAGTNLPYYLLGTDLRNHVRAINVDEHRDWLMHDYHQRAIADGRPNWPDYYPAWDRETPDRAAWLENLRFERIEFLVVARHNVRETWPIELQWAIDDPQGFQPVYGAEPPDPLFRVFRVVLEN